MRKNRKSDTESALCRVQRENKGKKMLKDVLVFLIFSLIIFVIYSNSYDAPFYFDDHHIITTNPRVHASEFTFSDIIVNPIQGLGRYRAIPIMSFALNFYFGRLDTGGYHLVNILLHILASFSLFILLRLTLIQYSRISDDETLKDYYLLIPFWGAFLWAVNPVLTSSVTYIVQRMNIMATLFSIISLILYVKWRMIDCNKEETATKINGYKLLCFVGCVFSGIMALLSKHNAAILPFNILLYEWFF